VGRLEAIVSNPRGRRNNRRDEPDDGLIEKTVYINRVAKVVKGGRRFNFTALVVVGDGNGRVGVGYGKANEVPEAIRKGGERARRAMIDVPILDGTVPHFVIGKFGAASVVMRPASPGTGVIAGTKVRAILDAAGYRNVLTKVIGSTNPNNVVKAVLDALDKLESPAMYAARLGRNVDEFLDDYSVGEKVWGGGTSGVTAYR
jgi:small subunit ribosomal protein S5